MVSYLVRSRSARLQALEVSAAETGDLDGELSPGVGLGSADALAAGAAFDGEIDGALAAGVALGAAPIPGLDASFDGEIDGALSGRREPRECLDELSGEPPIYLGTLMAVLAPSLGLGDTLLLYRLVRPLMGSLTVSFARARASETRPNYQLTRPLTGS